MLQLSNAYLDKKIMSLHNGAVIAQATEVLINPENLKIEGWFAESQFHEEETIVLTQDVREYTKNGLIVNSHEALTLIEDLVRLKSVINARFEIIGKKVVTESKSKLGNVVDYAVDSDSMFIQKLYVDPPLVKTFSLNQEQKIVDRSMIVEITDSVVVVKDPTVRSTAPATAPASA